MATFPGTIEMTCPLCGDQITVGVSARPKPIDHGSRVLAVNVSIDRGDLDAHKATCSPPELESLRQERPRRRYERIMK